MFSTAPGIFPRYFCDHPLKRALVAAVARSECAPNPLDVHAHTRRIVLHHLVDPVRGDRSLHRSARVVLPRAEERFSRLPAMPRGFEVVCDELRCPRMQGQVTHLATLAMHPQVQHPLHRVVGHRIRITEVVKERGEHQEPAPDGCPTALRPSKSFRQPSMCARGQGEEVSAPPPTTGTCQSVSAARSGSNRLFSVATAIAGSA